MSSLLPSLRQRRRLPPTREGWWFLGATLLVGVAAVNSGYNLLFLVWGMMLFLIFASGLLAKLVLSRLEVTRNPPSVIHAGAPFLMGIAVRNGKRRLPSFSIEAEDLLPAGPPARRCFFLKLPAGRLQQTSYRNVVSHRGYHRLSGFRLATKFPFGLIRKTRDISDPVELLVYPALVPIPASALPQAPVRRGSHKAPRRSRRGDFYGLREYRQGDDPRDIHWRTSARRGRPFVRESEDESGRLATILFDNRNPAQGGGGSGDGLDDAFEAAVSMAASLAAELLQRGYRVGFAARGVTLPAAAGPAQGTRIFGFLALVVGVSDSLPLVDPGGEGLRLRVKPGRVQPEVERLGGAAGVGAAGADAGAAAPAVVGPVRAPLG